MKMFAKTHYNNLTADFNFQIVKENLITHFFKFIFYRCLPVVIK